MTLIAEETEPAESELAPRVESVAQASLLHQAPDTNLAPPSIADGDGVAWTAPGERTLESFLLENGNLLADDALRILLSVCDAVQSVRQHGQQCRGLTAERIMVDSDGKIRLTESDSQLAPNEEVDCIAALTGLFYKMVIGKFPTSPSDYRALNPHLSPRLRNVICRATSPDPTKRYAVLDDFVCDLKREAGIQFYWALALLTALFGFALLLAMIQQAK